MRDCSDTTLVLCSFGPHTKKDDGLQPGLNSYRKWFKGIHCHLYTDSPERLEKSGLPGAVVDPPFDRGAGRYPYYATNFYKVAGCMESETPYALGIDADTVVISEAVYSIYPILDRFGVALPVSPRHTVLEDTRVGADSDGMLDESGGYAQCLNMTPICYKHGNDRADTLLQTFRSYTQRHHTRGPLSMWRAIWLSGVIPCVLPAQWCVCRASVGVKDPIILHVGRGEREVSEHYASEIKENS